LAVRSADTVIHRVADMEDGTVLQIDMWRVGPAQLGPFMVFATGPKRLNVTMRRKAQKMGLMLSQHGVFDEIGHRIDDNTEEDVFAKVGMDYMTLPERAKYGRRKV